MYFIVFAGVAVSDRDKIITNMDSRIIHIMSGFSPTAGFELFQFMGNVCKNHYFAFLRSKKYFVQA